MYLQLLSAVGSDDHEIVEYLDRRQVMSGGWAKTRDQYSRFWNVGKGMIDAHYAAAESRRQDQRELQHKYYDREVSWCVVVAAGTLHPTWPLRCSGLTRSRSRSRVMILDSASASHRTPAASLPHQSELDGGSVAMPQSVQMQVRGRGGRHSPPDMASPLLGIDRVQVQVQGHDP